MEGVSCGTALIWKPSTGEKSANASCGRRVDDAESAAPVQPWCIMKDTEASVGKEKQISPPFVTAATRSFMQDNRVAK